MQLAAERAARATRTPEGPATLEVCARGHEIEARAWGPGAEWALEHAPSIVGALDSPESFAPADRLMRDLVRRLPGLRIPRTLAAAETLIPTVVEQKVTSNEAHRAYARLVWRYGEPAPGPLPLRLPPEPQFLCSLPYWEFHRLGIERKRAVTVQRVCSYATRIDAIATMSSAEADARLRALPGVGAWSSAHVRQVVLGDPDAVIVGDFHMPHIVSWMMRGQIRSTDEEMLELLKPYQGHRGRALRLLAIGGSKPPRRAPRRRARNIAAV
jgi:3-methyladenine DNA glycosylase/8-oxoguanine DNA glycosylase